jgi:hypothetical protein
VSTYQLPGRLATLTHVFLSCPCSAPVWQWFANLWITITQGSAPRLTADFLLADDPRIDWYASAELLPLWHRLRLLLIIKLWAAHSTARLPRTARSTAAQIAARVMADARAMIRRNWLLVDTDIRQHTDVLSDWLRGRHPCLSRAAFVSRWCQAPQLYAGLLLGRKLRLTFCGQPTIPFPCRTAHHRPALALRVACQGLKLVACLGLKLVLCLVPLWATPLTCRLGTLLALHAFS